MSGNHPAIDLSRIKAVGYDLDNTLYVLSPAIQQETRLYIARVASADRGVPFETFHTEFEDLYSEKRSARLSLVEMGLDMDVARGFVQEALEQADVASHLDPDPRLRDILERIGETRGQFLITGSAEAIAHNKFDALQIPVGLFNPALYAGSQYERVDGTAFEYVAEQLGVELDELAFVGDRESADITPARRLGIATFAVNNPGSAADFVLDSIHDLEHHLL